MPPIDPSSFTGESVLLLESVVTFGDFAYDLIEFAGAGAAEARFVLHVLQNIPTTLIQPSCCEQQLPLLARGGFLVRGDYLERLTDFRICVCPVAMEQDIGRVINGVRQQSLCFAIVL